MSVTGFLHPRAMKFELRQFPDPLPPPINDPPLGPEPDVPAQEPDPSPNRDVPVREPDRAEQSNLTGADFAPTTCPIKSATAHAHHSVSLVRSRIRLSTDAIRVAGPSNFETTALIPAL
jgi:hypothetical protein